MQNQSCELIGARVKQLSRKAHEKTKAEKEQLATQLGNMDLSEEDSNDENYEPSESDSSDSGPEHEVDDDDETRDSQVDEEDEESEDDEGDESNMEED